jgi:serine/threonine protein kinase
MWAVGVVLYELMCMKHPFVAPNMPALLKKIVTGKYEAPPRAYSSDLRRLLDRLLLKDPATRPSVNEVLATPFIRAQVPPNP